MRGTTLECLLDYLNSLSWGSKDCRKTQESLVKFVGVPENTPRRWLNEKKSPSGIFLIKLRYFLEKLGYEVTDLAGIKEPVRSLGRAIAFNQIGFNEAMTACGYIYRDDFVKLLHGKVGTSSKKHNAIVAVLKKLQIGDESISDLRRQQTGGDRISVETDEILHLLQGLSGICSLLKPRLENILSDRVTAEKRQVFREKAGRQLIFDQSNLLYSVYILVKSMCSEKSREINKHGRQ